MRMLPGPSRPSAGRLGWWIVGCFLALVAAFWLTERTVDWLWMGTLGYRSVFWQIIDLRFALFAAAFVPLALVLLAQPALGPAVDGGLAPGDRRARSTRHSSSSNGRRCCAGRCRRCWRSFVAIGFAGIWDDAVRFLYGGRFGLADPLLGRDVGFYVFRLPLLEAVVHAVFFVALAVAARSGGARDRARRVPRLDAARRRDARSDSVCARLEPRRGRACFVRRLHPRSLQPALRLERHRLGPGLCGRARGDAGVFG